MIRHEARFRWDVARARLVAKSGSQSPIILNSIPKSGTHLAIKLLSGLPGVTRVRFQVSSMTAGLFAAGSSNETVEVGVAAPKLVSLEKVRRHLRQVPAGAFVTAHVPYSLQLANTLGDLGYRMVLLVRDPRDIAVSSAAYLPTRARHALRDTFAGMDHVQQLMAAIEGIVSGEAELKDLRTRVASTYAWRADPNTTTIRFEDLVGPAGGGELARQQGAIAQVADHLGVDLAEDDVKRLAAGLFGGTETFRSGQIGSWHASFDASHLEVAGPLVGDLVRELGYERDDAWWQAWPDHGDQE